MRSWPVALAFFASTTASAGLFTPSIDRDALYDFEGSISLEGPIEVPLYRPFMGSAQPCVEVVLEDGSVHLFDLNLAQSGVTVTAAFAKAAMQRPNVKMLSGVAIVVASIVLYNSKPRAKQE